MPSTHLDRGVTNLSIMLNIQVAAYDKTQGKMAFFDPSRAQDFLFISGTKVIACEYLKDLCAPVDGRCWLNTMKVWYLLAAMADFLNLNLFWRRLRLLCPSHDLPHFVNTDALITSLDLYNTAYCLEFA